MNILLLIVSIASVVLSFNHALVRAAAPLGGVCGDDLDCDSDLCSGDGKCICRFYDHYPCDASQVCNGETCISVEPDSVALGGSCRETSQCQIGECVVLFGGSSCVCNTETNEGCEDGTICAYLSQVSDAPPRCFVPEGGSCSDEYECRSTNCVDGKCEACNPFINEGCNNGETCIGDDLSGYECVGPDFKKELGGPCDKDPDCLSNFCDLGSCACNIGGNHAGCGAMQVCGTDGLCADVEPNSLESGDLCRETSQCIVGECNPSFFGATCGCSTTNNDGCEEGRVCAYADYLADASPECVVPEGGACVDQSDCITFNCVAGMCATCYPGLNVGCGSDEQCIGDDVMGYQCVGPEEPVCELSMACCADDCCGVGTTWDTNATRCLADSASLGWNGEHSEDYVPGCDHPCCEGLCCGSGTSYDETIDYCIPMS